MLYGNKGIYRGFTQYEIYATDLFADRRICVDKVSYRSRKAKQSLVFCRVPVYTGIRPSIENAWVGRTRVRGEDSMVHYMRNIHEN